MQFVKATKSKAKLRLALIGPSGSGKTYSALAIAQTIATNNRVAVIDTERGSASKYSGYFEFDVLELNEHSVESYIGAISCAGDQGYDVLIIDSLSHAWAGKGGILEFVDEQKRRDKNDFGAWRTATPKHNQLVDSILAAPMHVIVTMRSKTEYVVEKDSRGKTSVRKVGMQPIQRDGLEYEFDVVGDMDHDHYLTITKSRCREVADKSIQKPGAEFATTLLAWLTDGTEAAPAEYTPAPRKRADIYRDITAERERLGWDRETLKSELAKHCEIRDAQSAEAGLLESAISWLRNQDCAPQTTVKDIPKAELDELFEPDAETSHYGEH